jgi:hypothetical protein
VAVSGPVIAGRGLTTASSRSNFGAGSGQRTTNRLYVDPDTHAPWRAQVYGAAFETARRLGARKVLDFGCRFGSELAGAFQGTEVQTTGADLPLFARIARERYPDRAWVETYPTDYASLEALHARASSEA